MIVIGIDPDSDKHGVAIYEEGKLTQLLSWELMDFMVYFDSQLMTSPALVNDFVIHMENVNSISAVFRQRQARANWNTHAKMANGVGKCQQAQVELERLFERVGVKVLKHKPSKAWKKDKKQFELVTGWTGRSNEDTRSAAYFGYLGLKQLEE